MTAVSELRIERSFRGDAALLTPHGVLDLSNYALLRDTLLKCAVEIPQAVIVDVSSMMVPTDATLAVFPSVWMQVSEWPGVPIVLVAGPELIRRRIAQNPIIRYVPVHPNVSAALDSLQLAPRRRRTVLELPCSAASPRAARRFVHVICDRWKCSEVIIDAAMIANELVENAVEHAGTESRLRLELRRGMLTVAVYDDDPTPVRLFESWIGAKPKLGLMLVSRLASTWNCAPTMAGGKVVWAVVRLHRPELADRSRRSRRVISRE
jgi:hypothetical protein